MQKLDFIQLVEQRLAALETRLTQLVDHRLTDEVKKTLSIAKVDLPFSLAKARYVLELVIRDIYQRELPQAKLKPLFNMIEALCQVKGLFTPKLDVDVNYIRKNGNLIIHAQEETVDIQERDVEVILLVILNLVEWYLVSYMPAKAGVPIAPPVVRPIPPNPYRGLAAFREEDSGVFFGRDQEAADLVARVAGQPLVAVVGASGSGKSSLVYAGLFPRLRAQDQWQLAALRPQHRPFYELAKVLAGLLYEDKLEQAEKTKDLAEKLAGGQVDLTTLVELVLEGQPDRLLLVVDQFEELYTLNPDKDLQQRFVDVLLGGLALPADATFPPGETAARSRQSGGSGGLCLLFTLRADFMAHALACAPLARALDRYAPKLLGPIDNADDLRTIIEQPARQLEIAWEPLLIERILRDLRAQPAGVGEAERISLPLLQFTLEQLWQQQTERTLTHLAYEKLGGVQQALARHADTVLTHFDAPDRERLPHIFTQLVCPGEGTEDTRQVATKPQVGEAYWNLVSQLADERLVVTGRDAQNQDTVELIHEALIRHWPQLRAWITEDRAFRLWQNKLRDSRAEWADPNHGRDDGYLLRGARLAEAQEQLAEKGGWLTDEEREYIAASVALREREAAEKERVLERERENQRRLQEAETARALAEAKAERERVEQIERQRQEEIATAKGLISRAETLWSEFREIGNRHTDDWRLMRLAEIESMLVDALAHDRTAKAAEKRLAGIRRLLVETGIKTLDLNFATIYLQKLKMSLGAEAANVPQLVPQLGKDLEAAWGEADPRRNLYVRRMRKWALRGCWMPLLWTIALSVVVYLGEGREFAIWLIASGGVATLLHYVAALFAVIVASGEQRRLAWTKTVAWILVFVGLAALNPVSIVVAGALIRNVGKIPMQKLFWPTPGSPKG